MNATKLSALIVSYNTWHYLDTCLRSIRGSDHPVSEIVVVDNGSVDGTAEKLGTAYPDVSLIQNRENRGFIRAVNQGLASVSGDRILLLDVDTELRPNAMGLLSRFLDDQPDVSLVVPRTYDADGAVQETARNFPSALNGLFGRQSLLTRLLPNNPFSRRYLSRDHLESQVPYPVEMVSAACMLLRRSIVAEVGGLDEGFSRYTGYWSDADWCKRMQKTGARAYCVPQAVIIHHEQNKPHKKKNPTRIVEFHTGAHRFYRRHYTFGWLDPRSVAAGLMLGLRAALLLGLNAFKSEEATAVDPLSRHREEKAR